MYMHFFFCYQHFARVSLIGIRAGCLFMGRFLHIYACKTHIHTGSCYIRKQPHSYNALLSTVITAHNKTNYCFLISPTALFPLSPNPRPVQLHTPPCAVRRGHWLQHLFCTFKFCINIIALLTLLHSIDRGINSHKNLLDFFFFVLMPYTNTSASFIKIETRNDC